jgi:hypothetical protein
MATSMQLSSGGVLAETFRTLKKDFFDPYRPELHYMRGPGPKWREKHEANQPANDARSRRRADPPRVCDDAHAAAF